MIDRMRRQFAIGLLALGIAVALAGCGGGSKSGSSSTSKTSTTASGPSFTLARTAACFKGESLSAVPLANKYLPGSGGNLRVKLGKNFGYEYLFIVFDGSHTAAVATENAAADLAMKSFAKKRLVMSRADVLAGVRVSRNVFYYSNSGAIPQNVSVAVQKCLR